MNFHYPSPQAVPLIAVEGTAYECGRHYGEIVRERFPGYRRYLDAAWTWRSTPHPVRVLFEKRAPHVLEIFRGLSDAAGQPARESDLELSACATPLAAGCTSFSVSGANTKSGNPISGQTKDTRRQSEREYIVLQMRMEDAPSILTLCYPGEVLGYGFWSNGNSIFRNSLFAVPSHSGVLTMTAWGLLALAGSSVHDAIKLASEHGIVGAGNCLISDVHGESASVEWCAGGVGVLPAKNGICTHANHPQTMEAISYEQYSAQGKADSCYRTHGLRRLLEAERGQLTVEKTKGLLSDHARYPNGICCHAGFGGADYQTTAAVIAEPTLGKLHVVRGQPCCNPMVTYSL